MKKTFLFVILLVSILVGCNNKQIFLSGESENWRLILLCPKKLTSQSSI